MELFIWYKYQSIRTRVARIFSGLCQSISLSVLSTHLFTCIIRWLLCSRPLRSGVLFLSFQALCPLWHECLLHILSWFRLGQWQPCGMKISLVLLIFLPVPSNVIFIVIMAYNRANYHNLIDKQQTRFFDNLMLGFKILKTEYPMGPSSKCHLTSQIRVIIGVAWGSNRYNEVLLLKKAGTDAWNYGKTNLQKDNLRIKSFVLLFPETLHKKL